MDRIERLLSPHPRLRAMRPGRPDPEGRCVLHWMQRAQRGVDNAALNLAIAVGNALNLPVLSAFGLTADYLGAQRRHYRFLLDGLDDSPHDLERRGIPFVVRLGHPDAVIPALAEECGAAMVVGDENPVRIGQHWRERTAEDLRVPFYLVDADVVVPASHFPGEEYAAPDPPPEDPSRPGRVPQADPQSPTHT